MKTETVGIPCPRRSRASVIHRVSQNEDPPGGNPAGLITKGNAVAMTSLPAPASQVKPKLGETNGDREYLMQVLRAATARAKLISNTLDSIGVALRQKAISVEDGLQ